MSYVAQLVYTIILILFGLKIGGYLANSQDRFCLSDRGIKACVSPYKSHKNIFFQDDDMNLYRVELYSISCENYLGIMRHEGHYPMEGVQLTCHDKNNMIAAISEDSIAVSELVGKLDPKIIYQLMNQALSNQLNSQEDEPEEGESHTLR